MVRRFKMKIDNLLVLLLTTAVALNIDWYGDGFSNIRVVNSTPLSIHQTIPKLFHLYRNDIENDREILELPTRPSKNYTFEVFGRTIRLTLEPNKYLSPQYFETRVIDDDIDYLYSDDVPLSSHNDKRLPNEACHYIHQPAAFQDVAQSWHNTRGGYNTEGITAALSFCKPNAVTGFVLLGDATIEITPLSASDSTDEDTNLYYTGEDNYEIDDIAQVYDIDDPIDLSKTGIKHPSAPHLIKKAKLPPLLNLAADNIDLDDSFFNGHRHHNNNFKFRRSSVSPSSSSTNGEHLTLEVALFFDETGYKLFSPLMKNDYNRLRNMLLAYINGVQAIYHHPSIGQRLDIALVRLEIFKKQPTDLPTFDGERAQLLNSFCDFNEKHNLKIDKDPGHWDIGLYISGLDFFAVENGRRSDATMGLSAVGGVCTPKYSCVIAEFGVSNALGKPYPSAGFTSVYVLAHEIGHNLGMHHDGYENSCPKDGYIMSASRGVTGGETQWSECSAQVMRQSRSLTCLQDSPKGKIIERGKQGGDTPGIMWNAKKQCEILLRDRDAKPIELEHHHSEHHNENEIDICQNLECETPHRTGRFFSGPALDGTICGSNKWCIAGECIKKDKKLKPKRLTTVFESWESNQDGKDANKEAEEWEGLI